MKDDSFPTLYYKYYSDISSASNTINWPPGGDSFRSNKEWDQTLGILKTTIDFKNVQGKDGGLALTLFDRSPFHSNDKVAITVSTSNT
jgi:hypothetical protein